MKVSDQLKVVKRGFENSNHTFFNMVAEAIRKKLLADAGIELALTGKTATNNTIEAALVGQSSDPEKNGEIEERVRQAMQNLKNPTVLVDLL